VCFAFGHTVYSLNRPVIHQTAAAHEMVHVSRQLYGPVSLGPWWDRYLSDKDFRFAEEIPAHQAEYRRACELAANRNDRRKALTTISHKLAGKLYNSMTTIAEAKRLLREGNNERET